MPLFTVSVVITCSLKIFYALSFRSFSIRFFSSCSAIRLLKPSKSNLCSLITLTRKDRLLGTAKLFLPKPGLIDSLPGVLPVFIVVLMPYQSQLNCGLSTLGASCFYFGDFGSGESSLLLELSEESSFSTLILGPLFAFLFPCMNEAVCNRANRVVRDFI